ncbi:WxL domain-containing protein [Enterococcus gilvus]|uniref:WxL domain-containing protein n=1 Tax=Enterococcus gilvus TaxID=160453 RepID=UPI001C8C70E9|nr:WxL domain-containing protein [Enterococcus gilvus]
MNVFQDTMRSNGTLTTIPWSVSPNVTGLKNGDSTWDLSIFDYGIVIPSLTHSRYGQVAASGISDSLIATGIEGSTIKFKLIAPQVREMFEDETGATIPPPSGYANDKYTDVYKQPQGYQMDNDSNLPKTYDDSGFRYTYKGWYKGKGKQSTIVTTHPPSIGFSAGLVDADNEVHIVYNKKAIRTVNKHYINTSSAIIDPSWNTSETIADGETFTGNPSSTSKTDSSGAHWTYQGWKLSTEPMSAMRSSFTPISVLIDGNKTVQYVFRKQQHTITEKFVDQADGSTLVPLAVNPKTSTMDDNDNFTGTASATITDTHGALWDFVGWENVTDNPGNVNPSAAYALNNVKGGKEIRYHYKARNTTATLDLKPIPQVTDSGGTVNWSSRLTNTGSSALNNLKLKATSNWAAGLSTPTKVTVTPAGGAPQDFTISPSDWVSGFNLTGINIPSGGVNNYADITFTDTATGAVNQVLPAEIEVSGNMASPITVENFVRIDDPDEPNLKPSGNSGLLNIPNFKFGEVEVKPFAQRKGLDSSEYSNPSYNPYIRYMDNESIGTHSLTVKMGPFTSGSKTLPAATSIILGTGTVKEVQNYNKPNETLSAGSSIGPMRIESDNTTSIIHLGNTQGVYQIDYDFNDVELDLVAHSGVAGLEYKAVMDWTLTTAP